MRVHTRFARICNIFGVTGVIVRMPYLPSWKVRWDNSICHTQKIIQSACIWWSEFEHQTLHRVMKSVSFSCFNDLKLSNTISMAPRMVSLDLVFYELLEKVTFVDFQQREQGFWLLNRDSQSKIWKLWTTLNANHGFHGNQSCVKRLIFGQAFTKTLLEWNLRRVTGFLLGGTMCPPPPPPLVFGAQYKPGCCRGRVAVCAFYTVSLLNQLHNYSNFLKFRCSLLFVLFGGQWSTKIDMTPKCKIHWAIAAA